MIAERSTQFCAFCGLPLPGRIQLRKDAPKQEVDYCCSGCRAIADIDQAETEQGKSANSLLRLGLAVFFTMNVMVFTMALWSQDVYPEGPFATPLASTLRDVFRWATLVFSLPVLWLLGGPIVRGVLQAARQRIITTDLLILGGVSAAYGYSIASVLRGEGHVYFEVGSMVLVFVSIGRWLEAKGKLRTNESLDRLTSLLPETARRKTHDEGFLSVPREEVKTGDVLRVLAGERIPTDGIIRVGQADVDEQMVSGESLSCTKSAGDQVFGGTLNIDGDLQIEVTADNGNETLSRMVELVRTARSVKGRQERMADRIAAWFVPAVCLVAVFAGWRQGLLYGMDQGIMTSLAVALIACPCALGLATPMAVWTALGRAAECGVLFRSGLVMEKLAKVRYACFDKTGTLTENTPIATAFLTSDTHKRAEILQVAASVAQGSRHQLSEAIVTFANGQLKAHGPLPVPVVRTIPGRGLVSSHPDLGDVLLGSQQFFEESQLYCPPALYQQIDQHSGEQHVFAGWDGEVRGAFSIQEQTRAEAAQALAQCRKMGIEVKSLTGDTSERAATISNQLQLQTQSGLLPEQKYKKIRELSALGTVAMVGDGLNDAPALAAADVGVALGCGADVSRDAAGVCLQSDDLRRFPWAVELARTTSTIVAQNLFWAFSYNIVGITLAATGRLNPIWAALAMALSSLLVVTNSLRLHKFPATYSHSEGFSANPCTIRLQDSTADPMSIPTHDLASVS